MFVPVTGDRHVLEVGEAPGVDIDPVAVALAEIVDVVATATGREDERVGAGQRTGGNGGRIAPHVIGAMAADQHVVAARLLSPRVSASPYRLLVNPVDTSTSSPPTAWSCMVRASP